MMPIGTVPELNQHNEGQKPKKTGARNFNSSPDISTKASVYHSEAASWERGGGSALVVAADKAMLWQYMVADRATPTAKAETTMAPVGCRAGRHLKYASQRLFDQNCDAFEGSCLCSTLDSYFWERRSDPDISPNVSRGQPYVCSFIYHQCSKESSSPSNLLYCRHFDAMVELQGGVHP